MDTIPATRLTSEEERLLLRLIYFPDIQPSPSDAAAGERLLAVGLLRREPGRLVVTDEGLSYFTLPLESRIVPKLAA